MGCKQDLLVYFINFLDLFGIAVMVPVLASHSKLVGTTPTQFGLISSVYGLLQFFSSPVVGHWSDRVGRRWSLMVCLVLSSTGYFLFGVADSVLLLLVSRIPSGLFKHTDTISKAYLAEISPPEQHTKLFGYLGAISATGFIVGPLLGGYIASYFATTTANFVLAGFIFNFNALLVFCLLHEPPRSKPDPSHAADASASPPADPGSLIQGLRRLGWARLWHVLLVFFLLTFSKTLFRSNFILNLEQKFSTDAITNGYIISMNGVVIALSSACTGRVTRWFGQRQMALLTVSTFVEAAAYVALGTCRDLRWFVLWLVPFCACSCVNAVMLQNETLERGPADEKGTLMGVANSLVSISMMLAPALSGYLLSWSADGPIYGSAFLVAMAAFFCFFIPSAHAEAIFDVPAPIDAAKLKTT